ncbi:MAG: hypothetical protein R6U68_01010 [Desulfobacteraceae bacterium]
MSQLHLKSLKKILNKDKEKYLFKCIKDLVENGLVKDRFPDHTGRPSRQDITQFIASWFRYAEISADQCREWMLEYCVSELAWLSSSSPSRIRHSTKGNIKYIYRSEVEFVCLRENNPFGALCDDDCPVYREMTPERVKAKKQKKVRPPDFPAENGTENNQVFMERSVKETYKEQFEKAMAFALDQVNLGTPRKKILTLLKNQGFKTITGKEWSYSMLSRELKRRPE